MPRATAPPVWPERIFSVLGTAFEAVSDADGQFSFRNLPTGDYKWRVQPPDGKARDHKVVVPADAYDIEV